MNQQIYLDYAASTPCDIRVVDKMIPYFTKYYGNASNASHDFGKKSLEAVEYARFQVSQFLNCLPQQIIWTSGATESNNLAIQGSIASIKKKKPGEKLHIITSAIEHKAVLETCKNMEAGDVDVSFVKPDSNGVISFGSVADHFRENTCLVSIMLANNELGTINDLTEINRLCKNSGVLFHTDATQYLCNIPLDLQEADFDLMSFSGHKLYAPKGVGALYVREEQKIKPIVFGGGHENGYRSGTLNVPGIVGLGEACSLCMAEQKNDYEHIIVLRDLLENLIKKISPDIVINAVNTKRLPGISNITFPVKEGYSILQRLTLIACSSGAACDTPQNIPSHVMASLGKTNHQAKNSLRFSLGRFTQENEIFQATEHLGNILKRIS